VGPRAFLDAVVTERHRTRNCVSLYFDIRHDHPSLSSESDEDLETIPSLSSLAWSPQL